MQLKIAKRAAEPTSIQDQDQDQEILSTPASPILGPGRLVSSVHGAESGGHSLPSNRVAFAEGIFAALFVLGLTTGRKVKENFGN